ncbi:PD-(D/E)XK nuclease domain-containing protein [Lentzea terrae]|uniref:PD-(D/E)XK nuclease domain-containing protein n=1 Tax=Lentzea terrae TaxID=2200761 RepID=UPI000DD33986|nr:hypothetical protein [Lentzea terrae]
MRSPSDFKKVEQEVMVDSVAYLQKTDRYREMIVFIYDESSSVEHHDLTVRELREVPGIVDVIIVCQPGVLRHRDGNRDRLVSKRKRSKANGA